LTLRVILVFFIFTITQKLLLDFDVIAHVNTPRVFVFHGSQL